MMVLGETKEWLLVAEKVFLQEIEVPPHSTCQLVADHPVALGSLSIRRVGYPYTDGTLQSRGPDSCLVIVWLREGGRYLVEVPPLSKATALRIVLAEVGASELEEAADLVLSAANLFELAEAVEALRKARLGQKVTRAPVLL